MSNIWLALIPTFFVFVVSIGVIIYQFIFKSDYYILKIIAFVCVMVAMFIFSAPYFQDMVGNETTVVVAEYNGFEQNSKVGTRKVRFVENGKVLELFVPGYARDVAKLQDGQTYEIEYFNNSKVIKSYKPID